MVRPYAAGDRYLLLRDACELIGLLDGVGRRDQVAVVRLERWQRARGDDDVAGHGRVVFSTGHATPIAVLILVFFLGSSAPTD
jgi:hypothetical protein